jgi:phosphoglycolate phosphatase
MDIIFDLDGTLVDSLPGIKKAFKESMEELGCEIPSNFELKYLIGKPLFDIFFAATQNKEKSETAITIFRNFYQQKYISDYTVYSGVAQTLQYLFDTQHRLYVVTNKAAPLANYILKDAGLNQFFVGVYGPDIKSSVKKSELIAHLLQEHPSINTTKCWLIGDTVNDAEAATAYNIKTIIMLHGYGQPLDFKTNTITKFCNNFSELQTFFSGNALGI